MSEIKKVYQAGTDSYLPAFEGFAHVEIMGHRSHYGYVKALDMLGPMLYVLVPALPETPEQSEEAERQHGTYNPVSKMHRNVIAYGTLTKSPIPGTEKEEYYYPPASLFCIHPVSEAEVMKSLEDRRYPETTIVYHSYKWLLHPSDPQKSGEAQWSNPHGSTGMMRLPSEIDPCYTKAPVNHLEDNPWENDDEEDE